MKRISIKLWFTFIQFWFLGIRKFDVMSFSGLLFNEFRYDGLFEFSFGFWECKVNFIHLLKWILEKQKIYIKNKKK